MPVSTVVRERLAPALETWEPERPVLTGASGTLEFGERDRERGPSRGVIGYRFVAKAIASFATARTRMRSCEW